MQASSTRQRTVGEALQNEIDFERSRAASVDESLMAITLMMCSRLLFLGEGMCSLKEDINQAASG